MNEIIWSIYKITNTINNKVYIGQSRDTKTRWSRHKSDARLGKKYNYHLYDAMRKYGIHNFIFEIIAQTKNIHNIDDIEITCIKQYNSTNRDFGYNISNGGQLNKLVSSATRAKMSQSAIGRFVSKETREKLSAAAQNRKHTIEAKQKISESHKGKKISDDTKYKLSMINTGKIQSKETINKRSKSMLGKNKGIKNGMYGAKAVNSKLTYEQAEDIRHQHFDGVSCIILAEKYNVSKKTILNIIHYKTYLCQK